MTNIFFEIHSGLPREGPGAEDSMARAGLAENIYYGYVFFVMRRTD